MKNENEKVENERMRNDEATISYQTNTNPLCLINYFQPVRKL